MNKKVDKIINILAFLVFCLVAICAIVLTVKFITPPKEDISTSSIEETLTTVEKDKNESSSGNSIGNMLQHYTNSTDYCLVESNNNYIFKYQIINGKKCLTKTDIKTQDTDIIFSGYQIKNMNIIKKNLYMVIQQYEDEKTYQVIACMDINTNKLTTLNTTKSTEINSFMSDGENIYYTIKNDNYIYKMDSDNAIEKLYKSNAKATTPFIIGIKDGLIYYVNGLELCTLGIHSHINTVISNQYCSVEQYPIMTSDGIICFQNLGRSKLDYVNFDGTFKETILEESAINMLPSGISSINYSCGYIFILSGDTLYYLDKTDYLLNQIKETKAKTNQFYFTDKYLIVEDEKYGYPKFFEMTWLLAQ